MPIKIGSIGDFRTYQGGIGRYRPPNFPGKVIAEAGDYHVIKVVRTNEFHSLEVFLEMVKVEEFTPCHPKEARIFETFIEDVEEKHGGDKGLKSHVNHLREGTYYDVVDQDHNRYSRGRDSCPVTPRGKLSDQKSVWMSGLCRFTHAYQVAGHYFWFGAKPKIWEYSWPDQDILKRLFSAIELGHLNHRISWGLK